MTDPKRPHRGTIFVEDAVVLSQQSYPGRQYVLRLQAPRCAARATAGSFAHVAVDPAIPMRRPLSIIGADAEVALGMTANVLGHPQPTDQQGRLSRLPRRLRHRSGPGLAGHA